MFVNIFKPTRGQPMLKQNFGDRIVDNLTYLFNSITSLFGTSEYVANGSFESDGNNDGIPDGWTKVLYTGGSGAIVTDSAHGGNAYRFTRDGTVGHGGGHLESTDFFGVTAGRSYVLRWQHKVSAAALKDKVELLWFDSFKAPLSSVTLYESTDNPTAWIIQQRQTASPAGARYAKVRLTGGFTDTAVAGSSYFDDVQLFSGEAERPRREVQFNISGTHAWVCPSGIASVTATVAGGGGGGAAVGGGGGGGGVAVGDVLVSSGTAYTVIVGAGGAGGSGGSGDGASGGDSSFAFAVVGGAGAGGIQAGAGGTGGTAAGSRYADSGENGAAYVNPNGGRGGNSSLGGGGTGGSSGVSGGAGSQPAGGGGGGGNFASGGAGGTGLVVIEY